MSSETPLQFDMFTGGLVDRRTPAQKREPTTFYQPALFPVKDRIQFGERSRPYLSQAPKPPLELVQEDPRTPEEIERDKEREAEKLTTSMFPDEVVPPQAAPQENTDIPDLPLADDLLSEDMKIIPLNSVDEPEEDENEAIVIASEQPVLTPYAAYMELVRVSEEQAATVSETPITTLAAIINLNISRSEAKHAGLTEAEIAAARIIGTYRGMAQWKETGRKQSSTMADIRLPRTKTSDEVDLPAEKPSVKVSIPVFIAHPEPAVRPREIGFIGFRRRVRQELVQVRQRVHVREQPAA